jgi:hypothetical protein
MKSLILKAGLIGILAYAAHHISTIFLEQELGILPFYYIFFTLFSIALLWYLQFKLKGKEDKIGFVFMASIIVKMALFFAIFSWFIYGKEALTMFQKIQFLTPFFVFLIFEVLVLLKSLNNQVSKPNSVN